MVAPDDSISITNNTVGGSGRVRALKQVVVGSRIVPQDLSQTPWNGQNSHAVPNPGGYYTGNTDRMYTFTVNCATTGGCAVGSGTWTLAWNDGTGNSGSLNFGAGYASPTFLPMGSLGVTLALYSGSVKNGESFAFSARTPRDTFQYTINREPHTQPLVIVSYNDPQGNHRFVIPPQAMSLTAPTDNLSQFAGQMLPDVGVEIVTAAPFAAGSNGVNLLVNNPAATSLANAHLFLEFVNITGTVVSEVPLTVTLPPGPTYTPITFNSSAFNPPFVLDDDYIVMAFLTDYQGNILDTAGRPLSSFQEDPLPKLTGDAVTWNIGTVAQGSLVKTGLPLANTGFGVLYTYLDTTPGLSLNRNARTVGAADLVDYELVLRTAALPVGPYDQTATLHTSDPNRPNVFVRVLGQIAAPTGDTSGGALSRPLDVPVSVQGPQNQGDWVEFTHSLGPNPESLHPVKVLSQDYATLYGVGKYATAFGQDITSYDMFGDGRDGDITVNSSVVFDASRTALSSSVNVSALDISLASANGFSQGDEVLIIQIQGAGAGNYDFRRIAVVSGNQLTLNQGLSHAYTNNNTQIVRVPNYHNVIVTASGRWVAPAWDGRTGGVLVFRSSGILSVDGVISSNGGNGGVSVYYGSAPGNGGSGGGFRGGASHSDGNGGDGGAAYTGEGSPGLYGHAPNPNGQGGGGGQLDNIGSNGNASGGGGGHANSGGNGVKTNSAHAGLGGGPAGNETLSTLFLGGGGGGGYKDTSSNSGGGGGGGGIILVMARDLQLSTVGTISSNGGVGGNGADEADGGGGAGGTILLKSGSSVINVNRVTALGGPSNGYGGTGSYGRIRLEYCEVPPPFSTNPPASTQKLSCYIAEQVDSTPFNTTRINLPDTIPDGQSHTYEVQFGRKLDFITVGSQITTMRIPAGMAVTATLNALVSGIISGTTAVKLDIGNDGTWDWQTSRNITDAYTFASPDLAGAFNAYWSAHGAPTTGTLDVPVKLYLSKPAQALLTNIQLSVAGSKLRGVRVPAHTYGNFMLDFTVGGSGTGPLTVALDVGDNGSMDWSYTGTPGLPYRLLTGNLSAAVNAYLSGKSGDVDVPVRIFVAPDHTVTLNDYTASVSDKTDLTADGFTVNPTTSQPTGALWKEGDVIPVRATIRNTGNVDSGPVTAAFFATAPGWGDWYIGSAFVANLPKNGGSAQVNIQWDTTGFTGNVPVKVVVNPYGRVAESNTQNNSAGTTVVFETTPTPTPVTPTNTPTPITPTNTPTPVTPTNTPTPVTPTHTPTPVTPTHTPTPVTPTNTPTPVTPTNSPTPVTSTHTPTPVTPTDTPTPVTPTNTPTPSPTRVEGVIKPGTGGNISASVGVTVSMAFLPGSVDEDVQVTIEQTDDPSDGFGFQVAGHIFKITARTLSGNPVTTFDPPFYLVVRYDSLPLGLDTPPALTFWQENKKIWVDIPTVHNQVNHTLTAVLDHLTIFAVIQRERKPIYLPLLVR